MNKKEEKKLIEHVLQKLDPKERELIEEYVELVVIRTQIEEKEVFSKQLEMIKDAHESAIEFLEMNQTVQ